MEDEKTQPEDYIRIKAIGYKMYCLDAGVVTNSFIEKEKYHEFSKKLVDKIKEEKISVILPEIVFPEVASAISRGLDNYEIALRFTEKLRQIPNFVFIPIDAELSTLAAKFAAINKLRGGDALYVAVAFIFNVKLITLDSEQKDRADGLVRVLTPAEELRK